MTVLAAVACAAPACAYVQLDLATASGPSLYEEDPLLVQAEISHIEQHDTYYDLESVAGAGSVRYGSLGVTAGVGFSGGVYGRAGIGETISIFDYGAFLPNAEPGKLTINLTLQSEDTSIENFYGNNEFSLVISGSNNIDASFYNSITQVRHQDNITTISSEEAHGFSVIRMSELSSSIVRYSFDLELSAFYTGLYIGYGVSTSLHGYGSGSIGISDVSLVTSDGAVWYSNSGSFLQGPAAAEAPEPAGWAMMVVGFGIVGRSARRRRSVSTLSRT